MEGPLVCNVSFFIVVKSYEIILIIIKGEYIVYLFSKN